MSSYQLVSRYLLKYLYVALLDLLLITIEMNCSLKRCQGKRKCLCLMNLSSSLTIVQYGGSKTAAITLLSSHSNNAEMKTTSVIAVKKSMIDKFRLFFGENSNGTCWLFRIQQKQRM